MHKFLFKSERNLLISSFFPTSSTLFYGWKFAVSGGALQIGKGIGKGIATGDGKAFVEGVSKGASSVGGGIAQGAGSAVMGTADGLLSAGKGIFSGFKSVGQGFEGAFTGKKLNRKEKTKVKRNQSEM